MKTRTLLATLVLPALLLGGCVTTSTRSTTWGEGYGYGGGDAPGPWARYGRVESVRESVHEIRGDPGAGAAAYGAG